LIGNDVTDIVKASYARGGYAKLSYSQSTRVLTFTALEAPTSTAQTKQISNIPKEALLWFVITANKLYIKYSVATGGLLPATTLYPGSTLYPSASAGTDYEGVTENLYYTQKDISAITVNDVQIIDYIQILTNYTQNELLSIIAQGMDYDPTDADVDSSCFLADFANNDLDAGSFRIGGYELTGWAVYREKEGEGIATHITDTVVDKSLIYDYGCELNNGRYRYAIYPIASGRYITSAIYTDWFTMCSPNWSILETEEVSEGKYKVLNEFLFGKNIGSGNVSNNNSATVAQNFTRYASVLMSNVNYQSGVLTSMIGHIGYAPYIVQKNDTLEEIASRYGTTVGKIIDDNEHIISSETELEPGMELDVWFSEDMLSYRDDKKLRDDIWNLSTTQHTLFLKSRKGDVIEIKISDAIGMTIMDESAEQAITASIPWVQVGDTEEINILGAV
jgi:hypothetical protein